MKIKQTYKDFLTDDDFIRWRLAKYEKTVHFEDSYIVDNHELRVELEKAIEEFYKIRLNKEFLSDSDVNKLWERIEESANLKRNRKKLYLHWIQYAAAACLVLAIGFSSYLLMSKQENSPVATENIIVGENLKEQDIKLITHSQTTSFSGDINVNVDKNGSVTVTDVAGNEEKQIATEKETVNKIIVPYGKRSQLELSDGTKVWVNSGSVLEFPSKFIGKTRTIRLAGEIFLEVTKDKKPFIVNTSEMDITVYGTVFNVAAYADRNHPSVVLVEGKVGVKTILSGEETIMKPREMVSFQNNSLYKETVDTRKYTSWKDGYLLLDQTPIHEVLKYMEKYYNLSFDIKDNVNLHHITCTGKIHLTSNLDNIMQTVSLLSSTKYRRENNKIYIEY
jgi:ferric-dicitrate binding protein FerR (iron transport regulator)